MNKTVLVNIPSVKPDVSFINDVVDSLANGSVRIPLFQRPFVWQKKNIIALWDSIFKGYPIGSILLWDGGGGKLSYSSSIGGLTLPQAESSSDYSTYIVDGQQRLTTLYCCLSDEDTIDEKWSYYFDLRNDTFVHKSDMKEDHGAYLNLKCIKKTTSFLREAKRILSVTNDESYVEKAEVLSDKIRNYKLAVINLEGGSLAEVVEIFSRLNHMGKEITQADLVYALTYTGDDDNKVNGLLREMMDCFTSNGFSDVDQEFCLQVVKTALGLEVYDKEWQKLASKLKTIDMHDADFFRNVLSSLKETLSFFKNKVKLNKIALLPYMNQFFMVFNYFYASASYGYTYPLTSTSEQQNLKDLFFFIALHGLGGTNPSTTEKIIQFFRGGVKTGDLPDAITKHLSTEIDVKLKDTFNAGSAIGKIICLVMYNYFEDCLSGEMSIGSDCYVYPPGNIFGKVGQLSKRLGQKNFFSLRTSSIELDDIKWISDKWRLFDVDHISSFTESERLQYIYEREDEIKNIFNKFTKDLVARLHGKYHINAVRDDIF